ncbi:MAG: hypothetical protein IE934_07380 [Sphingopyxis sp.]|nr:hypothetical protein [Sphingopyxis sp.]
MYQFFVRGGRPTLMWVGVVAAAWSLCVGEWFHMPMPNEKVMIVLSFVATIYGLRSIEKTKGVA